MMKHLLSIIAFLCVTISFAQTTSIPDPIFEAFLEANSMGDGTPNNQLVTTANISGVTALDVRDEGITDLTGIEDFTALQDLRCDKNDLLSIDVSNNTNLIAFQCDQNPNLAWINIKNGNNSNIPDSDFRADNNASLTCIIVDDVNYSTNTWSKVDDSGVFSANNCAAKTYVPDDAFENYLETHDKDGILVSIGAATSMGDGIANNDYVITFNIASVISLNISSAGIVSLEGIEDFDAIESLYIISNSIENFDLNDVPTLISLNLSDNALSSFVVATPNNVLKTLGLSSNPLSGILDLSNLKVVDDLRVKDTSLSGLNLKNGNNAGLNSNFEIEYNPNLLCVDVDIPSHFEDSDNFMNFYYVDNFVIFSTDCVTALNVESNELLQLILEPNPATTNFVFNGLQEPIEVLKIYNVQGKLIREITNYFGERVDISSYASGLYFVSLLNDSEVETYKLIKTD